MSQNANPSEEKTTSESAQATPAAETATAPVVKTGNLADTNSDEYKHKHGEHHHHHHHHHHHRHFHILNFSASGIRDNFKLLFKTVYSYPYIFLFLSLIFLFVVASGLLLAQLNAHKGSFSSVETFYRWQEFLVMNRAPLIRIPFQLTLVVSVGITIFLMCQQERHWQRNVLKILPALAAAALFSLPAIGSRMTEEEFARSSCRDSLRNYYAICTKYANRHGGSFPKKIPRIPSKAAKYGADHYIYHGANKSINDELFILLEDKKSGHVGNFRYAIRNDGTMLVSKYGGLYEEYKTLTLPNPDENEEEDDDFDWDEDLDTFLTNSESNTITKVEGTIEERSILPNPAESDYPNCRFTAHFIGNTIISGLACPKEINLIIEGFENFAVLGNDRIKSGDKVVCTLIPFDKLPEDEQSTQQADDLDLYLLESYYAVDIKVIENFSDNGFIPSSGILFSDGNEDYISIFERHINPSISERIQTAQNISIQKDLEKMNKLLDGFDDARIDEINRSFSDVWKREQEKDAPGHNRVGDYVWRNIDNSFWALPKNYTLLEEPKKLSQETLDCFSSLKKVLEENGVQLIVSLVPSKDVISSRVMNRQFRDIPDIQTATYVKQLSEIGIETIYASDSILQNYNKYPFAFFYPLDKHPSDTTQDCLSDILVERLKRYNIPADLNQNLFSVKMDSSHIYYTDTPYLFPEGCDIGSYKAGDSYECRHIYYQNDFVTKNKNASVLVLGNSFILSPMSPSSPEALPTLLSYKMHSSTDWYRISGYGPFSDIMIQLLTNPDKFLRNKKVLIMQVGTDHLQVANSREIMLDIAQLDSERVLLNNRKMKSHFALSSNVNESEITDVELWGPLSNTNKSVHKIDKSGKMEFAFDLEQTGNINNTEPIICFIPHMCVSNTSCKLMINNQQKTMHAPNYAKNAKFFNLVFELPAGTKEIRITVSGKEGFLFAIKDIQIWQ